MFYIVIIKICTFTSCSILLRNCILLILSTEKNNNIINNNKIINNKIYFSQATVLVPDIFPFHFDYWNQPHSVKGYKLHFYELSHLRVEQRFIISMAFVYLFIWEYRIKNSVNISWLMFFVYWHILPFLEQSLSIICQENQKYDLTYCMPCCTTCNNMYAFQLIMLYLYHFIRLFFSYIIYKMACSGWKRDVYQ